MFLIYIFTGTSDRTQCAFCAGIIKNWHTGDNPMVSHKNYFSYCKFAQGKQTHNIPYADYSQINSELMNTALLHITASLLRGQARTTGFSKATTSRYSLAHDRVQTYKDGFEKTCPISAMSLSQAGFYSLRNGDKVKCFWCDGALEQWSIGDDPWQEHAR